MNKKIIFGIIIGILILVVLFGSQNLKSKFSGDYTSLGTTHSVQELLSNPHLIKIQNIEEGKYIHLIPDGEGREYGCAYLNMERLANKNYLMKILNESNEYKFLNITDEDLTKTPQYRELIAATHQIEFPEEGPIDVFKSVPEHEQKYYIKWYNEKINSQFGTENEIGKVLGFVYNNEFYSVGFSIC